MLYYYREENGDGDEIFGDGVGKKIVEQAVERMIFNGLFFCYWRMLFLIFVYYRGMCARHKKVVRKMCVAI